MTPEELEMWTEWAGKFEYEALMPRQQAEKFADEALTVMRLAKQEKEREAQASSKFRPS